MKKALVISVVILGATAACGGSVKLGSMDSDSGDGDGGGINPGAGDDASSFDAGVCTPDPPDAIISGTGGGQEGAPYCPWNGCLDGPKASCGSDRQWHCPSPPPTCVGHDGGGGAGNTCTASGGTCVITNNPCPAGTAPDGKLPNESGCNQEPGEICCRPSSTDAGSFACGNVTCNGTLCSDHPPGVTTSDGSVPPDFYTCDSIPPACVATPTCACIVPKLGPACLVVGPNGCKDDGAGHVTVVCEGV